MAPITENQRFVDVGKTFGLIALIAPKKTTLGADRQNLMTQIERSNSPQSMASKLL
jgi:hypothetical protein